MSIDPRVLDQCESEALHRSGAIQPHGTLVVADADGGVTHAAANCQRFVGASPASLLGAALPPALAAIVQSLHAVTGSRRYGILPSAGLAGTLDVVATRADNGAAVLECTPHGGGALVPVPRRSVSGGPIPDDDAGLQKMERELVEAIAELTAFQRVMYYRFRDDGDGEVIAEARRGDAYGSYLGLRFPAGDIPRIARSLYARNPWRMIGDAAVAPVPIVGVAGGVPDLTYADLRSVSPVHAAYLANMGVRASLSFPITVRGDLIALVAAHHRDPHALGLEKLERGSALVRSHAVTVSLFQSQQSMRTVDRLAHRCRDVRALLASPEAMFERWDELLPWLQGELRADGALLAFAGRVCRSGGAGSEDSFASLEDWFARHPTVVATADNLERETGRPTDADVAGALALRVAVPGRGELRLYLTRREYRHEVAWGGNPEKPVETAGSGLPVSPRRSFDKWIEKRRGYCRTWDRADRLIGLNLRNYLDAEFGVARRAQQRAASASAYNDEFHIPGKGE